MKLNPYQACRTTEGWIPIQVPSRSTESVWVVLVCPWEAPSENICECPAYIFRGNCHHQEVAQSHVCGWTELQVAPPDFKPKYIQTEDQRRAKICPRCGGPTLWRMEVEDDDENDESGS